MDAFDTFLLNEREINVETGEISNKELPMVLVPPEIRSDLFYVNSGMMSYEVLQKIKTAPYEDKRLKKELAYKLAELIVDNVDFKLESTNKGIAYSLRVVIEDMNRYDKLKNKKAML